MSAAAYVLPPELATSQSRSALRRLARRRRRELRRGDEQAARATTAPSAREAAQLPYYCVQYACQLAFCALLLANLRERRAANAPGGSLTAGGGLPWLAVAAPLLLAELGWLLYSLRRAAFASERLSGHVRHRLVVAKLADGARHAGAACVLALAALALEDGRGHGTPRLAGWIAGDAGGAGGVGAVRWGRLFLPWWLAVALGACLRWSVPPPPQLSSAEWGGSERQRIARRRQYWCCYGALQVPALAGVHLLQPLLLAVQLDRPALRSWEVAFTPLWLLLGAWLLVGLLFLPLPRNPLFAQLSRSLTRPERGHDPHPAPELALRMYRLAFPHMAVEASLGVAALWALSARLDGGQAGWRGVARSEDAADACVLAPLLVIAAARLAAKLRAAPWVLGIERARRARVQYEREAFDPQGGGAAAGGGAGGIAFVLEDVTNKKKSGAATLRCSACGNEMNDGSAFCRKCGGTPTTFRPPEFGRPPRENGGGGVGLADVHVQGVQRSDGAGAAVGGAAAGGAVPTQLVRQSSDRFALVTPGAMALLITAAEAMSADVSAAGDGGGNSGEDDDDGGAEDKGADGAAARAGQAAEAPPPTCSICFEVVAMDAHAVLLPCGHGGLCSGCAKQQTETHGICPFCRQQITQVALLRAAPSGGDAAAEHRASRAPSLVDVATVFSVRAAGEEKENEENDDAVNGAPSPSSTGGEIVAIPVWPEHEVDLHD